MTKKYILFSDGDVTSFGELVGSDKDGKHLVKNPAYIGFEQFAEEQTEKDGLKTLKYKLRARFAPYIPMSALVKGDNTWKVTAKHVLDNDSEFHPSLIEDYETQIGAKPVSK